MSDKFKTEGADKKWVWVLDCTEKEKKKFKYFTRTDEMKRQVDEFIEELNMIDKPIVRKYKFGVKHD